MPIPDFNAFRLLPEGTHACSLEEVRERFGTFQSTDRRPRLFEKQSALIQQVWQTNCVTEIIVDGNFVTAVPNPNDIDLLLALSSSHDFSAELRPFEYNVLSARQMKKTYGADEKDLWI